MASSFCLLCCGVERCVGHRFEQGAERRAAMIAPPAK